MKCEIAAEASTVMEPSSEQSRMLSRRCTWPSEGSSASSTMMAETTIAKKTIEGGALI